jgi:hypothetical protein
MHSHFKEIDRHKSDTYCILILTKLSYDIIVVFPFRRHSFGPKFDPFVLSEPRRKDHVNFLRRSKTSHLMSPNFSVNTFLKAIAKIHILSPTESL